MGTLELRLLGRFQARAGDTRLTPLEASARPRELLGYLIVFRSRPHHREALSDALWGDCPGSSPRKNLRQALWQLQGAMKQCPAECGDALLELDPEWVRVRPDAEVWTDVQVLERAFARSKDRAGEDLSADEAALLREAVDLYAGDLLEGWYQDWCLFERERLKSIYLAILDKLLAYSEAQREWDAGLAYGSTILRYDRAHERAHRQMMRLHYRAGDRTAAVRQYWTCSAELGRALGIEPGEATTRLFEEICADRPSGVRQDHGAGLSESTTRRILSHMRQVRQSLAYTENLLAQDIADLERPRGGSG